MFKQSKLFFISSLIGLLYSYLFYNKTLGISYPIFIGVILLLLAYCLKKANHLNKNINWLFSIPIVLLSLRFFVSSNNFFDFFNHIAVIILFVGTSLLLVGKENYKFETFAFLFKIVATIFLPLRYFIEPYIYLYKKLRIEERTKSYGQVKKVILGVLISLPLLLIIIELLSSADLVFNEIIVYLPSKLFYLIQNTNFFYFSGQLLVTLLVATYVYSYILNLFINNKAPKQNKLSEVSQIEQIVDVVKPTKVKIHIDSTVLITVLVMINLVYIVFCYIQFSYLFTNGMYSLPGNFTYAEYARQGFSQLLLVSMLNFLIILSGFYFKDRNNQKTTKIINILLFLMGTLTFVMIFSSFYRMNLYSVNFGYTYLRIFVYFFLLLETVLLASTLVYIIKPRFNLAKFFVITSLIFYLALNYLNVDTIIAKNNIDRYFENGKIDVQYLKTLSYDAVPEITRLLDTDNINVKRNVVEYLNGVRDTLHKESKWQEFNYSFHKTKEILEVLKY